MPSVNSIGAAPPSRKQAERAFAGGAVGELAAEPIAQADAGRKTPMTAVQVSSDSR